MKMSKDKQQQLYDAIHEQGTRLRISLRISPQNKSASEIDFALSQMINKIWHDQKQVLKIE